MARIARMQKTQRMSRIVVNGDTIYLAGHTAPDSGADVAGQLGCRSRTTRLHGSGRPAIVLHDRNVERS